jgi:uncharacterized membrane protein YbhN (UPF0104 family)
MVLAIKVLVLAAVVWGVGHTLLRGWDGLSEHQWRLSWAWLATSGALYGMGLLPAAWYWRRAMIALGGRPDWLQTLTAYFAGHLAKYVPGKVLVVALRAGLLPRTLVPLRAAVISVFLETFTTMAVGAAIVVALSPLVLALEGGRIALALAIVALLGVPTLPPVARWLIVQVEQLRTQSAALAQQTDSSVPKIDVALMLSGWLAGAVLWTLFGLSLGAMIRAIDATPISAWYDAPWLISAVALASVAGFVSLMPGGFGVRDLLLVELLAPRVGETTALVAGLGLRLVWIVSELVVYGILYLVSRWHQHRSQ